MSIQRALKKLRLARRGLANSPNHDTALALQKAERAFQAAKREHIRSA